MPGPAAFRGIAGDVEKIGFPMAAWTFVRGFRRGKRIPATAATPIRQITLRTDIPLKLPFGRKAAQGAFHGHFLFRGCHFLSPRFLWIAPAGGYPFIKSLFKDKSFFGL
jgi:hypothetical protein